MKLFWSELLLCLADMEMDVPFTDDALPLGLAQECLLTVLAIGVFIASYEPANSSDLAAMIKSFLCKPFILCDHQLSY
jgi:hypothetical protein